MTSQNGVRGVEQVLGMIRRNITYKEKSLIVPLYKAIVRPHLEYCRPYTRMESISQERQLYYIGMINCNSDNYMSIWPISKRAWRALSRGAFVICVDMLEKIQRRATKLIPGLRDLSYEERLKECGLTTLETRRLRGDQIEVFKILNGYENIDSNIFF